ncbi:MAG: YlbF family regulator [Clostridia bacterium]|nr:YlbF family regulator [Clostridia bacterium]
MNKVIELAKELGEAMSGSDEFLRYRAAEEAYHADAEALRLTEEYGRKSDELAKELTKEDIKPSEMIKIRQQMTAEYGALCLNPVIKEFIESKQAAEKLLGEVNSIIHFYVTGEEEQSGGCSGNCSSCGGCH